MATINYQDLINYFQFIIKKSKHKCYNSKNYHTTFNGKFAVPTVNNQNQKTETIHTFPDEAEYDLQIKNNSTNGYQATENLQFETKYKHKAGVTTYDENDLSQCLSAVAASLSSDMSELTKPNTQKLQLKHCTLSRNVAKLLDLIKILNLILNNPYQISTDTIITDASNILVKMSSMDDDVMQILQQQKLQMKTSKQQKIVNAHELIRKAITDYCNFLYCSRCTYELLTNILNYLQDINKDISTCTNPTIQSKLSLEDMSQTTLGPVDMIHHFYSPTTSTNLQHLQNGMCIQDFLMGNSDRFAFYSKVLPSQLVDHMLETFEHITICSSILSSKFKSYKYKFGLTNAEKSLISKQIFFSNTKVSEYARTFLTCQTLKCIAIRSFVSTCTTNIEKNTISDLLGTHITGLEDALNFYKQQIDAINFLCYGYNHTQIHNKFTTHESISEREAINRMTSILNQIKSGIKVEKQSFESAFKQHVKYRWDNCIPKHNIQTQMDYDKRKKIADEYRSSNISSTPFILLFSTLILTYYLPFTTSAIVSCIFALINYLIINHSIIHNTSTFTFVLTNIIKFIHKFKVIKDHAF